MSRAETLRPRTATRAGLPLRDRARELLRYRELLTNLIRKELRVKYKNSTLGFVWSLINPLLYLVIFSVVFAGFLRVRLPYYAFFLLSGLIAWNLFSAGLSGATTSIVANSSLVGKVYFPREILPLSAVGAGFVHFVLQMVVLVAVMAATGYGRFWDFGLVLLPLGLAVEIVLVVGLALIVASVNVYLRDVEHLLELALLAWFWMTPIVYPVALVAGTPYFVPYLLNPMAPIALGFQRALYGRVVADGSPVLVEASLSWYLERLGYVAVGALFVFLAGWLVFRRLEGRIAEEI